MKVLQFEKKSTDFQDRMERIGKSLNSINTLMEELASQREFEERPLSYSERKTFGKYAELIKERDTWTKQDIISFASWMRKGLVYSDSGLRSEIKEALWYEFTIAGPKKITQEQSEFGIAWLRKNILTKKGELRDNKLIRDAYMSHHHKNVINNFSHFEFVGYDTDSRYGNFHVLGPVYRTYAKDGSYFDYSFSGGPYAQLVVDDFFLNAMP